MKTIDISERLKALTKYVSPYQYIVDVGTDHCFVPIYMKQKGLIKQAIASDVNKGPLEIAKKNVSDYGYSTAIETRLGNGLQPFNETDRLDVIIIAGMGGKLMTDILATNLSILKVNKRLIFQANVACDHVRNWCSHHSYRIIAEELIDDKGIIYEIIIADQTSESIHYTDEEIYFGPLLMQEQSVLFQQKWQEILKFKESIFNQIPEEHENKAKIKRELAMIKKQLNHFIDA